MAGQSPNSTGGWWKVQVVGGLEPAEGWLMVKAETEAVARDMALCYSPFARAKKMGGKMQVRKARVTWT